MNKIGDLLLPKFKSGELEVDLGGHMRSQLGPVKYGDEFWAGYYDKDGFLKRILGNDSIELFTLVMDLHRVVIEDGVVDVSFDELQEQIVADPKKFAAMATKGKHKGVDYLILASGYSRECSECGHNVEIRFDGNRVYVDKECSVPGGLAPWSLELDVPSGKLVFENDMRDLFPSRDDDRFDVNTTHGTKACEENYAGLGMFHCFVGNTCPTIYVLPDGRVIIGSYRKYGDEDDYDGTDRNEEHRVGGIGTDLWWFSACDFDEWVKRDEMFRKDKKWEADATKVVLPEGPGRYRCTSQYSLKGDEAEEYAVIEKIHVNQKEESK